MQQGGHEYLDYLRGQIGQIVGSIGNVTESYGILLLIGYFFVIFIVVLLLRYIHKTDNNITHLLGQIVDDMIYRQNTLVYNNRESIYKSNESLSVLYAHTQDMLIDPSHRDYRTMYPLIKQEKEYTEKFFSETMTVGSDNEDKIYHLSISIRDRYRAVQKTLIYLTLGIAKIFL